MQTMPILVAGNAGVVTHEILARSDIDAYWALSGSEVQAVLRREVPRLCIARQHSAGVVLDALKERNDPPPCVVLLERDGWEEKDELFRRGATALVRASAGAKILEAISILTGLAFAKLPRVRLATVAELTIAGGEPLLHETVDLSASGVCLRGVSDARLQLGVGATVGFPTLEPAIEGLVAMVARLFSDRGTPMAAFCFTHLDDQQRVALNQVVASCAASAAPESLDLEDLEFDSPEPTHDLPSDGESDLRRALKQRLQAQGGAGSQGWLDLAERSLTDMERAALRGESEARWAHHVLEMRLRICRAIAETSSVDAATIAQTVQVCREIGEASPRDEASLVRYTRIRSSLLKTLGTAPSGVRKGTEDPFALEPQPDPRAEASRRTVPFGDPEVLSEFAPTAARRSPRAVF
jgi:hypothetical protein